MKHKIRVSDKNFSHDEYLCFDMARSFYRDAIEHANLALYIVRNPEYSNNKTYLAKAFTMILMSAECLAKLAYINAFYKSKTPEQIYSDLTRKVGHKPFKAITSLMVQPNSKLRINKRVMNYLQEAEGFGVKFRYNLEVYLIQAGSSTEGAFFGMDKFESHLLDRWLYDFLEATFSLRKSIDRYHNARLGKYSLIRFHNLQGYSQRMKAFLQAIQ